MIFLLLACGPASDSSEEGSTSVAPELPLPDISDIDFPASIQDALTTAIGLTLNQPFEGNRSTLSTLARSGCPDFFVGAPPEADFEADTSWLDHCRTAGGLFFDGQLGWQGTYSADGDATEAVGRTIDASRTLSGAATVGDNDSIFLHFDGQGEEALYRVDAPGASHWTWSSLVQGTVAGDAVTQIPEGWRSDLYLYATGGDVDHLELRGNLYFPEQRIQTRFDSIAMDLAMDGALGALPETCTAEPAGWIGLRDQNAFWYDLVFRPRYDDGSGYPNQPYAACDGCGTLFLRGLQGPEEVATVCVDLSGIYAQLTPPDPETFILTLHELEAP